MDTPFRGSKKWCEGNKKYVLDGAAKLSQVLSGIVDVSDAAGINNDITKFSHLHARVFLTMTAIRAGRVIQTAALRNAFKKASTGRELSRYGAPLAAGPAAMCIELNMCSPVRANAILDAVRMGTAPYAPEVKKAAAKK